MTRTRRSFRLAWRNPAVRTSRTLNRPAVRSLPGHRRGPDDLSQALAAFRCAIRCHRRLAKLAPSFFDSAVVDREARERDERRRWMALWEPALARAYGCVPSPRKPEDDLPPLPPPQTQRAVDRQLACWDLWFNLGREALRRHQQRRPHELISFSRLARLIELASDLKRLACGFDSGVADPQPANHDAAWADLKRAYGHLCDPASSGPGSPLPLSAQESNPASNLAPVQPQYVVLCRNASGKRQPALATG